MGVQKKFYWGTVRNFYIYGVNNLRAKGLQDDEEKETINRQGMEVALGVYPNMQ
jgi:hypothetical protein